MNNIFSKVHFGKNDISTKFINKEYPTLVIEDMVAYLLHKQQHAQFNYIVLNSIANKDKVVKKLTELNVSDVIIQLKDDSIGRSVTQEISNALNNIPNKNKQHRVNKREIEQLPIPMKLINEMEDNDDKDNRQHRGVRR